MEKTLPLSEIAEVLTGVEVYGCLADEVNPPTKTILYYKGSACTNALYGQMASPVLAEVNSEFIRRADPQKTLRLGDIIIPRTYKRFGCGIYDGAYEECYADRNLFIIRGNDPVSHDYLSALFRSNEGEKIFRQQSSPTKKLQMHSITLKKLKMLEVPNMSVEQMKEAADTYERGHARFYRKGFRLTRISSVSDSSDLGLVRLSKREPENLVEMLQLKVGGLEDEKKELSKTIEILKSETKALHNEKRGLKRRINALEASLLVPEELKDLVREVEVFVQTAKNVGLIVELNNAKFCSGKDHSIFLTPGGKCILENKNTGGVLVYKRRSKAIIFSENIGGHDLEKFQRLSNIIQSKILGERESVASNDLER